jgi:hypothetical protein
MTTISYLPRATNFVQATSKEAAAIARIVDAAHPWLGLIASTDLPEFQRAFTAVGFMWRTDAPNSKHYFHHFIDAAADMLRDRWGAESVSGTALLGAVIGHADIVWMRAEPRAGVVLAVGLDLNAGKPCSNRWREVIEGRANLLPPIVPLAQREAAAAARSVST